MPGYREIYIYIAICVCACVCVLAAHDLGSAGIRRDTTQEFILESNSPSILAQKRHGRAASAADPDVTGWVLMKRLDQIRLDR